jgi:hypothetical protein
MADALDDLRAVEIERLNWVRLELSFAYTGGAPRGEEGHSQTGKKLPEGSVISLGAANAGLRRRSRPCLRDELLVFQRDHGIDAHRAARRDVAGHERDEGQYKGNGRVRCRVRGAVLHGARKTK